MPFENIVGKGENASNYMHRQSEKYVYYINKISIYTYTKRTRNSTVIMHLLLNLFTT